MYCFIGNTTANALKGMEPESSDSSDNESKDPYKLKDEMAAVGKYSCIYRDTFLYYLLTSVGMWYLSTLQKRCRLMLWNASTTGSGLVEHHA